jgi:hypothetical protein
VRSAVINATTEYTAKPKANNCPILIKKKFKKKGDFAEIGTNSTLQTETTQCSNKLK